MSIFATKDDLMAFKDEIIKIARILSEDFALNVKQALKPHDAKLDRIEHDLGLLNRKVDEHLERAECSAR